MRLYALVRLELRGGAGATVIVEPGAALDVLDAIYARELIEHGQVSFDEPYPHRMVQVPERNRQMRAR